MRCIFCKENSETSQSVEHIIPASLGNSDHILPPGWVCDRCNNYFSLKIEAPFLNSQYCKLARSEMLVPNRRGRFPVVEAFHLQSHSAINIMRDEKGFVVFPCAHKSEEQFIKAIRSGKNGSIVIPKSRAPHHLPYETARFIGKVALEALAHRCMNFNGWNDELVEKTELDELRNYVRRGRPDFIWPIHSRRIYPANKTFSNSQTPSYEVLHEFDILSIPVTGVSNAMEIYAVIAIFGIEYVINLAGPELDGYLQWLHDHNDQSYLYCRAKPE